MSASPVIIRLSSEPGDLTPHQFAARSEGALGPVIRALEESADDVAMARSDMAPQLVPGSGFVPPIGVAQRRGLPLSARAALLCSPLEDGAPPAWHTYLLWPRGQGAAAVAIGHILFVCNRTRAMVEITLPLAGFPLSDLTLARGADAWVLSPSHGRSERNGDWARWGTALDALNSALSDLPARNWDVEFTGWTAPNDVRRLLSLRDRLNGDAAMG